jgi:hypothetical protein
MNLFEIVNNVVTFSPQALEIKAFKDIWIADADKEKQMATKELSYVYYMSDERSDYMFLLDEQERSEEIVKALDLPSGWVRSEYLLTAIHYYKHVSQTTSTMLLQSTRLVLQKISRFLDDIDVDERDQRTNKPIHDIGKITGSVEKIPKLIKALNDIEKEIVKEKELSAQSGNKIIGLFDDDGM